MRIAGSGINGSMREYFADCLPPKAGRWRPPVGRAALAVCIAGVLLGGAPPRADAAYYYSWSISGGVPGEPGSGSAEGDLTFFPLQSKRYRIYASVRDICPADGKGMELMARVRMTNGATMVRGDIWSDENNCGPDPTATPAPLDFYAPNPIQEVRLELWATTNEDPYVKVAETNWKDQPET